jgi:hypothetical protein
MFRRLFLAVLLLLDGLSVTNAATTPPSANHAARIKEFYAMMAAKNKAQLPDESAYQAWLAKQRAKTGAYK